MYYEIKHIETFKTWANLNNLMNDKSVIISITWDNPSITNPTFCRYDV